MKQRLKKAIGELLLGGRVRGLILEQLRSDGILFCKKFGQHQFAFKPGEYIGECLLGSGEYQRDMVRASIEAVGFDRPVTILEIGSNIGTQTVYFFDYADVTRVIAVEPEPENIELLALNLRMNDVADRVTIVPMAASSSKDTVDFARFHYNLGRSAVVNRSVRGESYELHRVEADRADSIVRSAGIEPGEIDFVWVDAEEHEIEVLKGLTEIVKAGTPMCIEFSRHAMEDPQFRFFADSILPHYRRMRAHEWGLKDISIDELAVQQSQVNLLLT